MSAKFDKNNCEKIAELLKLKDKCFKYEKLIFGEDIYNINKNNWSFIYYHNFFSTIRDIVDVSLMFLINEEISNSIQRDSIFELIDEISNNYYNFDHKDDLKDLFVNRFNEILNSQLFDFQVSIFSTFEYYISKLVDEDEINSEIVKSRRDKYKNLIKKYNDVENEEEKDRSLNKIINLPGSFISFVDKINFIFKKIDVNKYKREIKRDKELIDFIRILRNNIHNIGVYNGKDKIFKFNNIEYKLENGKTFYVPQHSEMIRMYGELIDIYAFIVLSIKIDGSVLIDLEIDIEASNIFKTIILDIYLSKDKIHYELTINNLDKIIRNKEKSIRIFNFLMELEKDIKNEEVMKIVLSNE